jgi:LysR family transcriptional regulator, glycine cleavage system transcriptional activator
MPLRPGVLPALGVFAAAARHQNFAHAAEELHLTASAVSHHVRRLEATLGVSLFQRHARGVVLTAQGRTLADAATMAISDLEAVSAALRGPARGAGFVRITTLHSLAYCWLLPRLSGFTKLHPDIRVSIDTSITLTRFDDGGPDLGIRHGAGQWSGLTAYHLLDDALFPVASPTLSGVESVQIPGDIARLPLLADLGLMGWRDWFRAAGVERVRLPEMHTFSDSTDAMQAAVCGLGAALGRTHIAEPFIESGQLVRLPGSPLKSRYDYYLVHPSHRRPSAATAAFITWMRGEATRDQASRRAEPARVPKRRRS